MFRIGPGAAGAIEPVRLVHAEETLSLFYDGHLTANGICYRFQSAPPSCGAFVVADAYDIVFAHRALHSRGDVWSRETFPDRTDVFHRRHSMDHRERTRLSQVNERLVFRDRKGL